MYFIKKQKFKRTITMKEKTFFDAVKKGMDSSGFYGVYSKTEAGHCFGCLNELGILEYRSNKCNKCNTYWNLAIKILKDIASQ